MSEKIKEGTHVKPLGLPTGFKNQNLLGRTGKITTCVDYSGIWFYTVRVDRQPREKEVFEVPNVTASKLQIIKL